MIKPTIAFTNNLSIFIFLFQVKTFGVSTINDNDVLLKINLKFSDYLIEHQNHLIHRLSFRKGKFNKNNNLNLHFDISTIAQYKWNCFSANW